MNNNLRNAVLAGIALTFLSVPLRAQTAINELAALAGTDAAPIVSHMKATRAYAVTTPLTIPRDGKDVLEGCSALDAKTFMALNAKTAAVLVQTCLNNRYRADGTYLVQAQAARFSVRACPEGAAAECRAIVEVEGLRITVTGSIMTGDPVLYDLRTTLTRRSGKILGFDAIIDDQASILK